MGGGGDGRLEVQAAFFWFSVNKSISILNKIHNSSSSYFPILHVSTKFHYDRSNNKKIKIGSTVKTIRHDYTMSAEKPLS